MHRLAKRGLAARILLVDDRRENLHALESLLAGEGIEIYKAASGREALELLLLHDFALALLDVQMPDINGFELAELMRGSEKSRNVPILFVTAGAIDQRHTFRGYEAGAVDFLYKPLDPRIVKSKAQIFLELYRQKMLVKLQLEEVNKAQAELQEAKEIAEAASKSKSAFLANMSHEIRTPLGAILGFTELLRDRKLTREQEEKYLGIILKNGQMLGQLIDDILDLAKVEAGRLAVEHLKFSLRDLMGDLISLLNLRASEKGLTLGLELKEGLPEQIESDPLRLRQILMNIVGNAIKFTERGGVTVRVGHRREAEGYRIEFEVTDTGPGIAEEQCARLFQPFSQADDSTTRKFGGTGLGLMLSRRLAEALGGDVWLDREAEGDGATFRISIFTREVAFEKAEPAGKNESEPAEDSLKGCRVLIVEDSLDNQALLEQFLAGNGARVDFAGNGREGVDKALGEDYDLVLMDIQMPVLDGYSATKELRRKGFSKPIVALSAHAMKEDREKSFSVGCDEHLVKPIDPLRLIRTVARFKDDFSGV
jgi:signal transduction histidine kinase